MSKTILSELLQTKTNFLASISRFQQEEFNRIPFVGSWTAAQVAEHILKSVSGALEVIKGPVQPANRNSNEKVDWIRELFLDFGTKMISPEFVLPSSAPADKDIRYAALEKTFNKIEFTIGSLDLDPVCMAFEFPNAGFLTRTEWIWFAIYHTQRHNRQLDNIYASIKEMEHAQ